MDCTLVLSEMMMMMIMMMMIMIMIMIMMIMLMIQVWIFVCQHRNIVSCSQQIVTVPNDAPSRKGLTLNVTFCSWELLKPPVSGTRPSCPQHNNRCCRENTLTVLTKGKKKHHNPNRKLPCPIFVVLSQWYSPSVLARFYHILSDIQVFVADTTSHKSDNFV